MRVIEIQALVNAIEATDIRERIDQHLKEIISISKRIRRDLALEGHFIKGRQAKTT